MEVDPRRTTMHAWDALPGGPGSIFHFRARFQLPAVPAETALPVTSTTEAENVAISSRSYRVLVAEDNVVNQRLIVRLLEKQGHTARVANHGGDAVTAGRQERFDLVLMDVQIPEMSGFEATAKIRQHEAMTGRQVPTIALTARAMTGDREECLRAGLDDYLTKPINPQALAETIARVMHAG